MFRGGVPDFSLAISDRECSGSWRGFWGVPRGTCAESAAVLPGSRVGFAVEDCGGRGGVVGVFLVGFEPDRAVTVAGFSGEAAGTLPGLA